jgi:hypothetical protein
VPHRLTLGRTGESVAALALFFATSVVVFGWTLWPHPGRSIIGLDASADPEIFIWSFAWWAHALGSLTNPFVSHAVYFPVGANLMWTASGPGLGLAFTPLTWLVGPTVSYNLAVLVLPALAAWTGFLLCRYLTGSAWAAIVGGYLFGFSTYAVAHEWGGDPNLSLFVVPLVALVVLRHLRGELSPVGLAWRLGVLLAVEFTLSTELTLTLTLALAVALALAYASFREYRRRVVGSLLPIAAAYPLAALLAAPFVAYLVSGFESEKFVGSDGGDFLNILVPSPLTALGGSLLAPLSDHFTSNNTDRDLYIGIPTLVVFALYAWRGRRGGPARLLVAGFVVAWVLALGQTLELAGRKLMRLPWHFADSLPVLPNANPTRFAAYMALTASVAVALWIGSTRGRWLSRPVVLPALAVLSLVPASWSADFARNPERPEFFSRSLYKLCIPRGEALAIFPYARFGDSMLYQAESGFWFDIAEGNLGRDTYPPRFVFADPTVEALQFYWYGPQPRPSMQQLKVFATRRRVDRIVSVEPLVYPTGPELREFGPLQVLGGVGVAPACGYDSLAGDTRRIPGQ